MKMAGEIPAIFVLPRYPSAVVPAKAGTQSLRRMFCEGCGRCQCSNRHRCLWVPAFAGTTMEVQLLSFSSLGMCEPSAADSKPVFA
jgi:hypothetical protein